ncbi:MAG: CotY/CotZ family spore coat protein [Bacilli bacterium]|nr:CotY/CotZ family spore coat protein [Bacilli bacterium]
MAYEKSSFTKIRDRNCIKDTILKVDQAQKEALIEKECDTCERSLLQKIYNTRPVSLYLCNGKPFKAEIPCEGEYTTFFRIQEVKDDCVLLRILVKNGPTWECTDFTVLLDIECICAIQCFPPIWCEKCGKKNREY